MSIIEHFMVKGEYITLSQFLKEENIISSGGQAKWYLQEHQVLLNNQPEKRRGKKLHPGDQVLAAGKTYEFQ